MHGNEPDSAEVVVMGLKAADLIAERGGRRHHQIILNLLNEASTHALEKMLMQNEDRLVEMMGEGYLGKKLRAQSKAETLLMILGDRGLPLSEEQRRHILLCGDPLLLDVWIKRALRADTIDEVLG